MTGIGRGLGGVGLGEDALQAFLVVAQRLVGLFLR